MTIASHFEPRARLAPQVDAYVNQTINHVETAIKDIVDDAAQTANSLAHNITTCVEAIISKASAAIQEAENTFFQDASALLAQLNAIVQKGQCMEAGGAKQVQDQILKLLKGLHPTYRWSQCWRQLGFKFTTTLEDLTEVQLYDYQKQCTLLNTITPTTPIDGPGGLLQTYAQGQLYAAEYYCIGETANAPAFQPSRTCSRRSGSGGASSTMRGRRSRPCGTRSRPQK